MGREIRTVPPGWEHPKDHRGHYYPLFDQPYREAFAEWTRERAIFENDPPSDYDGTFEGWYGEKPDPDYYRPDWPEDTRTCFQMYETVSEGTPCSQVFNSLDSLKEWLIEQGYSENAASKFIEQRWCPSMIMNSTGIYMNLHAFDHMGDNQ
jgi:hypothetical protein